MMFTQMIRARTTDGQALADHAAGWDAEQAGIAPGYLGTRILTSRDAPDEFVIEVDFTSREEAEQNSDRAETAAWAQALREIVDTEPTYDSYLVVWSTQPAAAR